MDGNNYFILFLFSNFIFIFHSPLESITSMSTPVCKTDNNKFNVYIIVNFIGFINFTFKFNMFYIKTQ